MLSNFQGAAQGGSLRHQNLPDINNKSVSAKQHSSAVSDSSVVQGGVQRNSSHQNNQPITSQSGSAGGQNNAVSDAADQIEILIDSDGVFEWADRSEVISACNILANLDAETADSVIDELANRGLLNTFAAEVVDKSLVGKGLTADDRATLFDNFAKQLDAETLLLVSDAFRSAGTPADGAMYAQELTEAIKNHANPEVTAELTVLLAERAEASTGPDTIGQVTDDRQQAACLLTSLTGEHLESALDSLNKGGMLAEVLRAAVHSEVHPGFTDAGLNGFSQVSVQTNTSYTTYDTSRFDKIMENAAALSNNSLKAELFAAGVAAMQSVDAEVGPALETFRQGTSLQFNDEAANEMAASLTKLLDSDVEGIMDEITYGGDTGDGHVFTAYAKQMLEAGATDELAGFFAKLQFGNNLNGNPGARLEHKVTIQSEEYSYTIRPHADALGHFVGSIYAASSQITSDQKEQAQFATTIINSTLMIVDKLKIGPPGAGTGIVISLAKEGVKLALKEALVTQNLDVARMWETASIPIDPNTEKQAIGESFGTLTDRIDYIYRQNS
jgi:hypothetical protein